MLLSKRKALLALVIIWGLFGGVNQRTLATENPATDQSAPTAAEAPASDAYYRARVLQIIDAGIADVDGAEQEYQTVQLKISDGPEEGRIITIDHGKLFAIQPHQKVVPGETVVIAKPAAIGEGAKKDFFYIVDHYRLPKIIWLVVIFLGLALFFGGKRGFTSIFGLLVTLVIIFWGMIPRIIAGSDPLVVSAVGALGITLTSLYIAHGFNRRTTLALISTLLCLGAAFIVDLAFVRFAGLSGSGTEETFYLQFSLTSINLKNLLLGGIIIGVLGVLDDVTTGQTAAVEEIHRANPSLNFKELYKRGLSVGREHIASLINTLLLAYVGASFPLLLLFATQKSQGLSLALNSAFISEEIVRTLVGSCILVIAVPLSTAVSAYYFSKKSITPSATLENTDLAAREKLVADLYRHD